MSGQMTGLESLRWARENRERQTIEPIVTAAERLQFELNLARGRAESLDRSCVILGEIIGKKIFEGLLEEIRYDVAGQFHDVVSSVLGTSKPVTVTVDPQRFRWLLEPKDKILAEIATKAMRAMTAQGVVQAGEEHVRIHIPSITVDRVMEDLRPAPAIDAGKKDGAGGQDRTDASR